MLFCFAFTARAQLAHAPNESFWMTDGTVHAILETNGMIYLGGTFNYVGPHTGGGAPLNFASGQAEAAFPKINGPVYSAVADGAGGWYIGGAFTKVGNVAATNLVHVGADLAVDTRWRPNPTGGEVSAVLSIALAGNTVYAGGYFTHVAGQSRPNLAAINTTTGRPLTWNPAASSTVSTLLVQGGTVYVGGDFREIGGLARGRIAALDAGTGLPTEWNPNANSNVLALALSGNVIYAGGSFNRIGNAARNRVAALDAATGLSLPNWVPNILNFGGQVRCIVISGTNVYLGGTFTGVTAPNRFGLAAVDSVSGRVTSWNPTQGAGFFFNEVNAIVVVGNTVFAGGRFTRMGGQPRNHLVALDTATGLATVWNPNANDAVRSLAAGGNAIFVGGDFISVGGELRTNLAALDAATGRATAWRPQANSNVLALAVSGNTVYAGGLFSRIGGAARSRMAALDTSTGLATAWNPSPNGRVEAIAGTSDRLYVGGGFTSIASLPRNHLAAFDLVSGQITDWNPNAQGPQDPAVSALAMAGNVIYGGGSFTNLGGQIRNNLAALDAATGAATFWNPSVNGPVRTLALSSNTVFVGGSFTKIGVQLRGNLGGVNVANGKPNAWNPYPDGNVESLVMVGSTLYAGGGFSTMAGQPHGGVAALDAITGQALPWNPVADGQVNAIAAGANGIHAGGEFFSIGGAIRGGFASFSISTSQGPLHLVMDSLRRLPGGGFEGRAHGTGGTRLILQISSNLVDWSEWSRQSLSGGAFESSFSDGPAAMVTRRFYRGVLEP